MATTLTKENKEYVVKEWERVPCPFCGAHEFRPHEKYGPDHRYTYVQCEGCRLVYANPRPKYDEDFVHTAYEFYDNASHHVTHKGALSADERALVERYKITVRQIESVLGRQGKILDIGAATGLFLLAARELGWQTVGIDISGPMTQFCRDVFGIPAFQGQYHQLDLAEAPFDAIYCSHVIEHIPNPNEWVAKFRRDLKVDGVLCLNVPNQFSVDRLLKRFLKRLHLKKDRWELWRTPDHLYEPHLRPMRYLLGKHGFSIRSAFTYSSKERDAVRWSDQLMHFRWKAGSKLRLFARPNSKANTSVSKS